MGNFKLTLSYDGSRYDGWQRLGGDQKANTIQGKLEEVLSRMTGETITVQGSGRTDAGVHAYGQMASFHSDTTMTPLEIHHYLNRYLPRDIGVKKVETADERFHARLSAVSKTYLYRIAVGISPNVFDRKYTWYCFDRLDLEKMEAAAALMTGTHDYIGFSSVRRSKKSTVRTVSQIRIAREPGEVRISFTGDGFLYHMARLMTGVLIEIGKGERPVSDVEKILSGSLSLTADSLAPAQGLFLEKVEYR